METPQTPPTLSRFSSSEMKALKGKILPIFLNYCSFERIQETDAKLKLYSLKQTNNQQVFMLLSSSITLLLTTLVCLFNIGTITHATPSLSFARAWPAFPDPCLSSASLLGVPEQDRQLRFLSLYFQLTLLSHPSALQNPLSTSQHVSSYL